MKHYLRLLTMAAVLICGGAYAEEEDAETKELARVPQALSEVKLINKAKPNLDAKIYFVFMSRSTCGICVAEAPALVREYNRMKRQGCEMVMLNQDHSVEAAEKWVRKAKMDFPVVHPSQNMDTDTEIPWEYTGKALLPCMIAMTPDGTKLGEAGGQDVANFIKTWKTLLLDIKKEEKKAAAAKKKEKSRKADKTNSKKKDKKKDKKRKKTDDDDEFGNE